MTQPLDRPADPNDFDALWDYDRPAESEARLRAYRTDLSDSPAQMAELDTQIARAQGLQGQFEAAHATLDTLIADLEAAPDRTRIRHLLERGRLFNSAGEAATARPLFEEAWSLAVQAGEDFHAIDAAHMMAIVGSPEEQMDWNCQALELLEASSDERTRRWAGSIHNNLGWSHFSQGDFRDALSSFHAALAVREEQGDPGPIRMARWSVAKTLRVLGRVDEALAIQTELLAGMAEAGEPDGYVHEELAACYRHLGRAEEAGEHARLAAELMDEAPESQG